jgi:hypothetical protein
MASDPRDEEMPDASTGAEVGDVGPEEIEEPEENLEGLINSVSSSAC